MMAVVIMIRNQDQRLCKYTVEKYIQGSCLDLLVFSVYLNTNKKK